MRHRRVRSTGRRHRFPLFLSPFEPRHSLAPYSPPFLPTLSPALQASNCRDPPPDRHDRLHRLCVVLVAAAVTLNVGWILVNRRRLLPLVLGIIAFALIIAGIIVYTVFLVREMRRNEQHDAFINAVTHELKTPIASIRLYLQTLQSREVAEAQRRSSTGSCSADADRLQQTVEQVLQAPAGRAARAAAPPWRPSTWRRCARSARDRAAAPPPGRDALTLAGRGAGRRMMVDGDVDELRTALSQPARQRRQVLARPGAGRSRGGRARAERVRVRVPDHGVGIPRRAAQAHLQPLLPLPGARLQGQGHGARALHRALDRRAARRARVRRRARARAAAPPSRSTCRGSCS